MRNFMLMCTLLALVPFGMNAQQLKGDLDKDGRITPNDITLLIDAYLQGPAGYQSQGEIEIPAVQDGKIRLSAQQQGYVNGANSFAFDFYRKVAEQTGASESMILSPLSVIYALGLVNNGASAAVQKEIASVLGFGAEGTQELNAFCANLIANAPLLDEQVTLGIANAFFLNSLKGYTLYDAFKADMNNYYNALVEELDFSQQASCDRINAWASEQTHGMIPSVMKKLDASAISYILNALYFKGTWKYQFDEEYTQQELFVAPNLDEKIEVPMMSALIDTLLYVDEDTYSAVSLPYGNGAYSMTIVLPHPKESLTDIENMLTAEAFQQMQDSMAEKKVELHLPRFETEAEMPLVKTLSSLGISSAFAGEAFPYVCPETPDIAIGNVFQKAKIRVNEEGSEAAAVTVIEFTETAVSPRSVVFYANRPFLYFITERSTGSIFFMGRYMGR